MVPACPSLICSFNKGNILGVSGGSLFSWAWLKNCLRFHWSFETSDNVSSEARDLLCFTSFILCFVGSLLICCLRFVVLCSPSMFDFSLCPGTQGNRWFYRHMSMSTDMVFNTHVPSKLSVIIVNTYVMRRIHLWYVWGSNYCTCWMETVTQWIS